MKKCFSFFTKRRSHKANGRCFSFKYIVQQLRGHFSAQDPESTMKVCRNCHKEWRDGDKYCRYCGAPMGTPAYIPLDIECIYGPMPIKRSHECTCCHFKWETILMIDREAFCPQCGHPAPVVPNADD